MEQSADRGGAFHCIRQPGKQRELGALADNAAEDQKGGDGKQVLGQSMSACGVIELRNSQVAEADDKPDQTEKEAHVSDPVHYEGFLSSLGGAPFLVVEANKKIGRKTDHLPEYKQLEHAACNDHVHHGPGEKGLKCVVAAIAGVARHISQGINLHETGNNANNGQHEQTQRVEIIAEGDV